MNTEQFQAQQAAAAAIEAGVHDIAATQVKLNSIIERATEVASNRLSISFEKNTGYLPRNFAELESISREPIGRMVDALVKKYGAEKIASLFPNDDAIGKLGESYADHMLERTEHKMVDLGRRIVKAQVDIDRKSEPTFDETMIERAAAPTVNHAPVSFTPKSASDILVGIEHREAAGRQYPAKKGKK